jgi:hypothetical protein
MGKTSSRNVGPITNVNVNGNRNGSSPRRVGTSLGTGRQLGIRVLGAGWLALRNFAHVRNPNLAQESGFFLHFHRRWRQRELARR